MKRVAWKLMILFIWIPLFAGMTSCSRKTKQDIPLAKVTKGTLFIDLFEEGEIEAVNSINLSSPTISWRYGNLKITQLARNGQEVQAGDTVIVFDPSEVQKGVVEAESRLEISMAELEKLKAQHESDLEELNADYEVARLSQEISRIRFESAVYESDIKKKEIGLNLEKARISLEKAKEQIDNRIKIQEEEIKQKELSIERDKMWLQEAYETLGKMQIITPSPGIAIISHNWSSGTKYQVGDQCWSGSPLIQLPDLSKLKATVYINEVDIGKISKGMKVEIKPDAFSDSTFTGSVNSIANLAVNKKGSTKIKVFPVQIYIDDYHENLLPGLTVSCRILLDRVDDVLYIPLETLKNEGEKSFVFIKKGSGYEKTEVETGARNRDYIVVKSGVREGDLVALTDPFETEKTKTERK